MSKFPTLRSKEIAKALEKAGFVFIRQNGSHKIYVKNMVGITLPWHTKDMKIGTVKNIIKQSGLTTYEFLQLLK